MVPYAAFFFAAAAMPALVLAGSAAKLPSEFIGEWTDQDDLQSPLKNDWQVVISETEIERNGGPCRPKAISVVKNEFQPDKSTFLVTLICTDHHGRDSPPQREARAFRHFGQADFLVVTYIGEGKPDISLFKRCHCLKGK